MKPVTIKTRRSVLPVVLAALALTGASAFADGSDPISAASSTLTGLSAPVNAALIIALGVFGAFCIYKIAKAILRAM